MSINKIKKRNGSLVDFDRRRIEVAIIKAWQETSIPLEEKAIIRITDNVIQKLATTFHQDSSLPSVEDIQDIVERTIASEGFFDVAKAYILYRSKRAEARERERQELLQQLDKHRLKVTKRNGKHEPFGIEKIADYLSLLVEQVGMANVPIDDIVKEVKISIYDGISTKDINKALILILRGKIERDPDYSRLSARLLLQDIYKDVLGVDSFSPDFHKRYRETFIEKIRHGVKTGRLDPRILEFDLEYIIQHLDPSGDNEFSYLGLQTLYDRYLLRDLKQILLETPQYFLMRVALGLSFLESEKNARAIDFYKLMSSLRYLPSTPTLFHSGTTHPQMSSCYITTVKDDLNHIFKCISDNAQLAKWSGGLGNDWTAIRGTGALIKSTNVGSQGVIPFLKIVDSTTAAINRSGKRRGATCVYLETWHYDIEDFLELRKNTGDERRRTHDINTAHWIPDLFMKRVLANEEWTLFSPDETPDLHETYGKKFETLYVNYEKEAAQGNIKLFKKIQAVTLWRKMITMLFETGHPWITFKDACNIRSPQGHVGVIHSSNLCTEITLNTSENETAVCNLGSINLSRHIDEKQQDWDYQILSDTVRTAMRMLDNVIDLNFYPTKEAKHANMLHRPVGLGIMGFQDALYKLDLSFDSDLAVDYSDTIMEFISYHAILSSSELAKERGTYGTYRGSAWNRGIFPLDTLSLLEEERGFLSGIHKENQLDWSIVRNHVREHGMRNSNCMAIAPTATISNIAGCLPTIEPIYKNLYVKSNVSGEFTIINRFLFEDLKKYHLWDDAMLEKLKFYDGNIQQIEEIPWNLKMKYKEAFEIEPIWILRHAAHRGKWIDQSQSINIFSKTTSGKVLSDIYSKAWEMGLKTTYYLRALGASTIEKSTLDINKKFMVSNENKDKETTKRAQRDKVTCSMNDSECEACQ